MSKRKSPAEKDALAKEVTRLADQWIQANRGRPEFQPEHYGMKSGVMKADKAFEKALKAVETELCKERGLVYKKYQDGEYLSGGHRGVAHPKTKKETAEYFQKWYKKNRSKVLKRINKNRSLAGGANGDDDEGETDNEDDSDDEDQALAHPHFWNGQQWVPVPPLQMDDALEGDEIIGNGYYRMKNGCALYTGGSHVEPVNYSGELKDNSWYPMGYSGGARVMPVNHSAELKSSFGTF